MKKSLLALCLGVSLPCVAMAQLTPIIDPQWRSDDLKMRKEQKNCRRLGIIKSQDCVVKVYNQYVAKGMVPGTQAYIRKNYSSMSVTQLEDVEKQMNRKYAGRVRYKTDGDIDGGPEPGEITHDILVGNVTWLHKLMDEKGGEQDPIDTIFGRKTKHVHYE